MDGFNKISVKIRELIELNQLGKGLKLFKSLVVNLSGEWRDLASSLLRRYTSLHLERIGSLITKEVMNVERAKLSANLLEAVERLGEDTDSRVLAIEQYDSIKVDSPDKRLKHLLSGLIEEMGHYNKDVLDWYESVQERSKDWASKPDLFNHSVEELLDKSNGLFKQILSRIFREQKDENEYAHFFLQVPNQLIEILCFALLSRLWDELSNKNIDFLPEEKESIDKFFKNRLSQGILANAKLLKHLLLIFTNNKLRFPIGELGALSKSLSKEKNPFMAACEALEESAKEEDVQARREKAEKPITVILRALCFLAMYSLGSIRTIEPDKYRRISKGYLHRYFDLYGNSMEFEYMDRICCNDAVLMFLNGMQDSVNLGPFVIDANSYLEGAKLDIETFKSSGGEGKLIYSTFDWLSKLEEQRSRSLVYKELPELTKGKVADMYPDEESIKQKKINDLYQHFCLIRDDFFDAPEKK